MNLMNIKEVAHKLSINVRTIRMLRVKKRMPAPLKIGRLIRWRESDLDKWIASGCCETVAAAVDSSENIPVREVFTARVANVLKIMNIKVLGELSNTTSLDVMEQRSFGVISMRELKMMMLLHGIRFKDGLRVDPWKV